jgi:hypothetical protein
LPGALYVVDAKGFRNVAMGGKNQNSQKTAAHEMVFKQIVSSDKAKQAERLLNCAFPNTAAAKLSDEITQEFQIGCCTGTSP